MVKDVHYAVRVFPLCLPGIIRGKRGARQGHRVIGLVRIIGMGVYRKIALKATLQPGLMLYLLELASLCVVKSFY